MAKQMVSSKVKKFMTLGELEDSGRQGPVWVMNMTQEPVPGKVHFAVPKKNGQGYDGVRVPLTFIPIDLTGQVPKSQLMESNEFRQTVTKGLVRPVTREYAEILLATPDGRAEAARVQQEMMAVNATLESVQNSEQTEEEAEFMSKEEIEDEAQQKSKTRKEVSIKLKTIVANLEHEKASQVEIVTKLRNYGNLTLSDVAFLAKKFGTLPRVKKFLKEQKDELTAGA